MSLQRIVLEIDYVPSHKVAEYVVELLHTVSEKYDIPYEDLESLLP